MNRHVQIAAEAQDLAGWPTFFHGCITKPWEDAQQKWIVVASSSTKYKQSSVLGTKKLFVAVWEVSFGMWEHHKLIFHDPQCPWRQWAITSLNKNIIQELHWCQVPQDRSALVLTHSRAQNWALLARRTKETKWIQSVEMVRPWKVETIMAMAMMNTHVIMRNWLIQGTKPATNATL
jgi:hypothetical protein